MSLQFSSAFFSDLSFAAPSPSFKPDPLIGESPDPASPASFLASPASFLASLASFLGSPASFLASPASFLESSAGLLGGVAGALAAGLTKSGSGFGRGVDGSGFVRGAG